MDQNKSGKFIAKLRKEKSEIIKSINSHQYNSLDLVKVSNKYNILINYENGNL